MASIDINFEIPIKLNEELVVQELNKAIDNLDELLDLIPEWNYIEAKKLIEKIQQNFSDALTFELDCGIG